MKLLLALSLLAASASAMTYEEYTVKFNKTPSHSSRKHFAGEFLISMMSL